MNNPKITVVIPIYNVQGYLRNCVDSLLKQTYQNMEILLIDDGSTDQSGAIADGYAEKDFRVTVYHKENGGLSDARNYGIERAHGQYICFVDSDDYVSPMFLQILYENMVKYEADISGCVYRRTTKLDESDEQDCHARIECWNSEEALRKMLRQEDEFTTSACALLYKLSCFDNIRYPKGAYFEDLGTTYLILDNIKKMVRTSQCLYHYYTRDGSISNQRFEIRYMDQYNFAKQICSFIQSKYPCLVLDAQARLVGVCFNIYMTFERSQKRKYAQQKKLLQDTIKKYRKQVLLAKETPLKVKGACLISYLGMPACQFIYHSFSLKGK